MKRKKLFLTESEIIFLQEAIPNILADWRKNEGYALNTKDKVKRFLKKVGEL